MEDAVRSKPRTSFDLYKSAWMYSLGFVFFFLAYWGFRSGYLDLFIFNKMLAAVSAMLLGVVLLMGPFARCFPEQAGELVERKYVGIVAFWYALAHSIVSAFFIPSNYSLQSLLWATPIGFFFGLVGLFLLIMLYVLGHGRRSLMWLGGKNWFTTHSWGLRLSVFVVFLHVLWMKYATWLQWFRTLRPRVGVAHWELPPIGIWIAGFFIMAGVIRIAEKISMRAGKAAIIGGSVLWVMFCLGTVIWGVTQRAQ